MSCFFLPLTYVLVASALLSSAVEFQPCPILGPRFPVPSGLSSDKIIQEALKNTTKTFDDLVANGGSEAHGPISSNTTSFSIGLFSSTDGLNVSKPFFYEYHYTAPSLVEQSGGKANVGSQSIYRIGSVTQVFTTWLTLIEAGEAAWAAPVTKYIPELAQAVASSYNQTLTTQVAWEDVTLGDLAAHLSGISRDYALSALATADIELPHLNATESQEPFGCTQPHCTRAEFFADLLSRPPIYLPGTTPVFSNTAFQLLAYALESLQGKPFSEMFHNFITQLGMSSSSLATPNNTTGAIIPSDVESIGWSANYGDESPAIGMYSTIHDLSLAGVALLNSTLLPSAVTRRWLKPVSHTSNLRNAIGRPWIIFSATLGSAIDPRIEVFTNYGFIGQYSAYIGLTPDHNIGFVILAADSTKAADLNAHADFIGDVMLPGLEKAAMAQAGKNYAGNYTNSSLNSSQAAKMVIATPDGMPGLALTNLTRGNEDLRATLAQSLGVEPSMLSVRLYPTNSKAKLSQGRTQMAFRAVFQDEGALVDGGTPTCLTWEGIDATNYDGKQRDLLVFTLDKGGAAESVALPGWGLELLRQT